MRERPSAPFNQGAFSPELESRTLAVTNKPGLHVVRLADWALIGVATHLPVMPLRGGDYQKAGGQAVALSISWFVFAALKSLGYQDWNFTFRRRLAPDRKGHPASL